MRLRRQVNRGTPARARRASHSLAGARRLLAGCAVLLAASCGAAHAEGAPKALRLQFEAEVDRRLDVPAAEQQRYVALLEAMLDEAGLQPLAPQALVLVDRSTLVQAAFVLLRTEQDEWAWIGASPVSTGRVGSFDHFETPTGVFDHSLANPDFRAEGTFNEFHIRGYGLRGMRVFDFGWVQARRGWGAGGLSTMRLQMHATDPAALEARLGRAESKGCVRIPATLNLFIDRQGLLDSDYEAASLQGRTPWVLRPDRSTIAWPGRYLVIVDSNRSERPAWSPAPNTARSEPVARKVAGTP